jgi:ParB-like chromosome segregation protein Spo0J
MNLSPHPDYARTSDRPSIGLVESIRSLGQLVPIQATPEGVVLSGLLRYRACQQLGIKPWVVTVTDPSEHARHLSDNVMPPQPLGPGYFLT